MDIIGYTDISNPRLGNQTRGGPLKTPRCTSQIEVFFAGKIIGPSRVDLPASQVPLPEGTTNGWMECDTKKTLIQNGVTYDSMLTTI